MLPDNFDPKKPVCPSCGSRLKKRHIKSSTYKPEYKATLNVYVCPCRALVGIVVLDDDDKNVDYVVKDV